MSAAAAQRSGLACERGRHGGTAAARLRRLPGPQCGRGTDAKQLAWEGVWWHAAAAAWPYWLERLPPRAPPQAAAAAHLQAQHARRGKVHAHAAVRQVQAVQAGEAARQLLAGDALGAQVHQQARGGALPAAAHKAQHAQRGRLQLLQHLAGGRGEGGGWIKPGEKKGLSARQEREGNAFFCCQSVGPTKHGGST